MNNSTKKYRKKKILKQKIRSRKSVQRKSKKKKYNPQKYYVDDQREVIQRLYQGKISEIFNLGWKIISPFLQFLENLGIPVLLGVVQGADIVRNMEGVNLSLILKCYCIKVLLGVTSRSAILNKLFRNKALMLLLGFTLEQIEKGINCRGSKDKEGPMHPDTLINTLGKLSQQEIENLFNQTTKTICEKGYIDWDKARFALDSTLLETTTKYEGYGTVTIEKQKRDKNGKLKKKKETHHGFKLLTVYEVHTRLIVAAKITQIQEHDNNFTTEMIKLAQENTGAVIKHLVIDRGFLDGFKLWELNESGTKFIVPAKTNMDVTEQARSYRSVKPDKSTVFRQWRNGVTVMGIRELNTYDQYGNHKINRYSKKFIPNPINAIMVTRWQGTEYPPGKERVFLTNLDVNNPYKILEEYDLRSLIENTAFRELKQGWKINKFPKKTKQAVWGHIFFTLMTFNLCHAFQIQEGLPVDEKGIRLLRKDNWECPDISIILSDKDIWIFNSKEFLTEVLKFINFEVNKNDGLIEFSKFDILKEVV